MTPGTRIGSYEIVAKVGEGGMGEVYRARDTRLARDVAVKILPGSVAADAGRLARFEREAQTLATLNHPNIAQVYGFEEGADGRGPCLVMELLEGHSLTEVLTSGPLPVRKALDYASQAARGLAAAHERGIVHRDLKPDNLFVLPDGRVKILDFGLARQNGPMPADAGTMLTREPQTAPGTVMGTVGYMAPEQVRAESTDARSDLFSLGVVFYEMLAGQRAFRRETTAETMTAILREDPPDLGQLRADISPALLRIVHRLLEKTPAARFQAASDLAFALDNLSGSSLGSGTASRTAVLAGDVDAAAGTRRRGPLRGVALVIGGLAIALAGMLIGRLTGASPALPAPSPPAVRSSVILPDGLRISTAVIPPRRMAMSPDGQHVVFIGSQTERGNQSLWLLTLSSSAVRVLEGTAGASTPFWSPDGRYVAFSDMTSGQIKRVGLDGGAPVRLLSGAGWSAWRDDDMVLTLPVAPDRRILLTPGEGGEPRAWLEVPEGREQAAPVPLPGIDAYLYAGGRVRTAGASREDREYAYMVHPPQGPDRVLIQGGDPLNAAFVDGQLVYTVGATLFARAFDVKSLAFTGSEVVLATDVQNESNGANGATFAVSRAGTLAYAPASVQGNSRLTWLDRSGRVVKTLGEPGNFTGVSLSPDDSRLSVSLLDPAANATDVYLVDIARGTRQRLTFAAADERSSVWTPDGRRIVYRLAGELYARNADFTGVETPVLVDDASKDPQQVTRDGRLLYRRTGQGNDLWIRPLTAEGSGQAVVQTPFDENHARLSPDGQSMVYTSNESGRPEVYVISMTGGGGKTLVSTGGGGFPVWRRDGREIVYLASDNTLMSVPVSGSGAAFQALAPTALFRIDPQPGAGAPYDVTADGQHIIVNAAMPSRIPPSFTVIVNWPSLVREATGR